MTNTTDFDPIAYINTPRWQQVELGLERIEELLDRLGRPQDRLRFVHVAGTNGKGSVCTYIATALQKAGYTVYGGVNAPYIWLKVPGGDSWAFFDELLDRFHVIGTPGAGFGQAGEGFIPGVVRWVSALSRTRAAAS